MKNFKKRIGLISLALLGSASFLGGMAISQNVKAEPTVLETEFSGNGQFAVTKYSNVSFDYVDGAAEGLPAGYNGSVLKVDSSSGAAYTTVDFSASKILAKDVESIVVRAYSPDYTADDEFRTTSTTNVLRQYGAGKYDMSTWCDIPLSKESIADMTDTNGYLSAISLGLRDKGTISQYFYVDSITVNVKQTTKVSFNALHDMWNNYAYDNAGCTFIQFHGGISGNGDLNANFTDLMAKATLDGAPLDASNFSFYCPNWIGASDGIIMRVGTNPNVGAVLTFPKGACFNIGGTDTNIYEIAEEISFQFNGSAWAVYEKPVAIDKATFKGVWGTAGDFNNQSTVLLQYSCTADWNYADKGNLTSKIVMRNSQTGAAATANENTLVGWEGQKWIVVRGLAGYDVLEIVSGGTFGGGIEIPALTLRNVNGVWVEGGVHAPTTSYTGIAAGWNDARNDGCSQTILKFDVNPLGDAANTTNLASTINATAMMVKYNGKSFADIFASTQNAKYQISYAHGFNYFFFSIPEEDLVDGAIFEIENGTPFMNNYLKGMKLQYNATAKAWEEVIDLVYGEPTFANATKEGVGNWDWNHQTANTAVIKDTNYGYTIVSDWAMDHISDNLAATESVTSLSITLNGVSFYELYKADDGYRLNAQLGFFAFSVPTAALVASNGYEYPTLEIANGTPFYAGNYLPKTTLIYKDGAWQLKAEEQIINYTPDFVKIGELNNMDNPGLNAYGLSLVYNTTGFAAAGVQIMPASSTGFILNGEEVRPAVWGGDQLLFWLGKDKCEPNYNGYSHATLSIANGAKIVNVEGGEFTFKALTLYLVDGAWTTEKPEDYTVTEIDTTNYAPDFIKIGTFNHYDNANNWGLSLVYDTTGFTVANTQVMAERWKGFTINGEEQGVALFGEEQLLFWIKKNYCEPNYNGYSHATLEIAEGATIVNEKGKEFTFKALTLYLVDGAWTTEKPENYVKLQPTNFVGLGEASTKNSVVFTFADDLVWVDNAGNLADYVLLDGVKKLTEDGGSVACDVANKTVTITVVGEYSKLQVLVGGNVGGAIIPAVSAYSTTDGWSLTPQKTNGLYAIGVYGNNNLPNQQVYHTVLQFNEYFVYGGDNSVSDSTNMATSTAYDVANKVTLNGKSFYELNQEDSRFYIGYMSGGKYFTFQIPQDYLNAEPENGYEYHTIEIEEGTAFMDWKLPALTMISFDKVWMNSEGFNPEPLAYGGIPYGWNCMQSGSNIDTILQFGRYEFSTEDNTYLGDYLGADNGTSSRADQTNLAKLTSEQISTKLTINGVPAKDIEGITVSYAHGYSLLYISVPSYELMPMGDYKCVVLHIEANTIFKSRVLDEVTLYLVNGQWQTEPPVTIEDDAEGSYVTAGDVFGAESGYYADGAYTLTDADDNAEIISSATASENGVIYNFLYKSTSADFDYSVTTGASDSFGGVRVNVYRNYGETTQGFNVFVGGGLAGVGQLEFVEGEWYAIRIAITVNEGKIMVSVAADGVEYAYAETEFEGVLGEQIKLEKAYGTLTFADYRKGDIKLPTIYWQGKNVYRYTVGEAQPDKAVFMRVLSVTDNYDKSNFTADDVTVTWQEGAVVDGKLQKGEWTITFAVSDNAGNTAYYTVYALVTNPSEVTVGFNVNGDVTYAINAKGGLIAEPTAPVKAGDETVSYVFDGWYYGDKKWDFANDYALEDVELVAVFTAEYKEYAVTIVSEGLESNYTYALQLRYGSALDVSVFERDGYSYKLMVGDEEISSITVSGDMEIKVVYTADPVIPNPGDSSSDSSTDSSSGGSSDSSSTSSSGSGSGSSSSKGGCVGSISGAAMGLSLALASAVIFAKKGGKENE